MLPLLTQMFILVVVLVAFAASLAKDTSSPNPGAILAPRMIERATELKTVIEETRAAKQRMEQIETGLRTELETATFEVARLQGVVESQRFLVDRIQECSEAVGHNEVLNEISRQEEKDNTELRRKLVEITNQIVAALNKEMRNFRGGIKPDSETLMRAQVTACTDSMRRTIAGQVLTEINGLYLNDTDDLFDRLNKYFAEMIDPRDPESMAGTIAGFIKAMKKVAPAAQTLTPNTGNKRVIAQVEADEMSPAHARQMNNVLVFDSAMNKPSRGPGVRSMSAPHCNTWANAQTHGVERALRASSVDPQGGATGGEASSERYREVVVGGIGDEESPNTSELFEQGK
ncbi:hypothetical protein BU16DRAFT_615978 [Lophium mytilinum]|uniref:Fungal N-terminal domain-containing protein n=1 Tax=Lophium mytilinum TaxID=390894 RepID=A0A6A6QXY0_9PEZI|nr:hypothetical protein BU16DRAFT_615978 [Lophium mytilinum]